MDIHLGAFWRPRTARHAPPRWELIAAITVSSLAHALLLWSLHSGGQGESSRSVMTVALSGDVVVAPRPPGESGPASLAATGASSGKPGAPTPAPKASAALARSRLAVDAAANRQIVFYPAEDLDEPPRPLANPDLSAELAQQLAGRRLLFELWVSPLGLVERGVLVTGEVEPEAAAQIKQAFAKVRFAPGKRHGNAVGANVRMRLCFDDSGVPDENGAECWSAKQQRRP